MHKAVLILLLIVTNTSIAADEWNWVEIGKRINEKGIILTFYADLSTTSTENSKRKVWTLFEFSKQQGSIKQQEEYDCNQKTIKHLHRLNYYGNMGTGKFDVMTLTKEEQKFNPILPGHLSYTLLNIVCNVAVEPALTVWSKVGEPDGYDSTAYINHASIRKNGYFSRVWLLLDGMPLEKYGLSASVEFLHEYDCMELRRRVLTLNGFSGRMGLGNNLYRRNEPEKWLHIQFHDNNIDSVVSSLVCHGEWLKIYENSESYIDPLSIRKNGKFVTVWVLENLDQRNPEGIFSIKHHFEYDCEKVRVRFIGQTAHSELMGLGDVITSKLSNIEKTEWMDSDKPPPMLCN